MAKAEKRVKITLECTECKHRNYITMKNKLNDRERIEMKKYCRHDPVAGGYGDGDAGGQHCDDGRVGEADRDG